jgi:hypothetical protein
MITPLATNRAGQVPADTPAPLPESLVDTLSTILADALIEDLRKHPEITATADPQEDRRREIMSPVDPVQRRPRTVLPSPGPQ